MLKLKTKEEYIEAIKTINKTLLKLKSPIDPTRVSQGDHFADSLIYELQNNRKYYIEQLKKFN